MSNDLKTEADLRTVYLEPGGGAVDKQLPMLEKHSRRFIELSPFFCIGTSRPDGLADVSPRGGEPGFVHVLQDDLLAIPDRPGNNRLDTLTNIVHSPAVGLLFFVPGVEDMLRVNGVAEIVTTPELMERFEFRGKLPRSVMLVHLKEVYIHCTKALKRSGLWDPSKQVDRSTLPTAGEMFRDQLKVDFPAKAIDESLEANARDDLY